MDFNDSHTKVQCRACMCEKLKFQKFYKITDVEDGMKVYEIFKFITPDIVIQECDGLPQYICVGCLFKLKHAYQFQQICIVSDRKYRGIDKTKEEIEDVSDDVDLIRATSGSHEASTPIMSQILNFEQANINEANSNHYSDEINNTTETNQIFPEETKTTLIASMKVKLTDQYGRATSQESDPLEKNEGILSEKEIYRCTVCHKEFQSRELLKRHVLLHSDDKPFICPLCSKGFKSKSTLHEHKKRHSLNRDYQCPHCPSKFPCRSYVSKHIKETHSKTKNYVCEVCGSAFTRSYVLTSHKKIHSGDRPHKCERCPSKFIKIDHLRRHMRSHTGEKPYKCQYCHRAFSQSNDLNKHLRLHIGDKIYNCTLCKEAFKYLSELREHRTQHMGEIQKKSEKSQPELIEDIIIKEETILSP